MVISNSHLRLISRRFWGTVFSIVIALAVLVQLGRQAMPLVSDYKPNIEAVLSSALSTGVVIGELSAQWAGLRPKLDVKNVKLMGDGEQEMFSFSHAVLELGIWQSVQHQRLYWKQLLFENLNITLVQAENGQWQVKGFKPGERKETNNNRYSFDDPLDIFLIGRRVNVKNAQLNLVFHNGAVSEIKIPNISIENDDDFLRMTANAEFEDETQEVLFVLEGHGNPRDPSTFSPHSYFALKNLQFQKFYDVFSKQLDIPSDWQVTANSGVNLELWAQGLPRVGMTLRGMADFKNLHIQNQDNNVNVESIAANLVGKMHLEEGWQLGVQDFALTVNEATVDNVNINIEGAPKKPLSLSFDELDAEQVNRMILATGLTGDPNSRKDNAYIFHHLSPRGKLKNFRAELTSKEEGYFFAAGNLHSAVVSPVFGSPGISGLDGYVELTGLDGVLNAFSYDSAYFDFPLIYDQPLKFDKARAQMTWSLDLKKRTGYLTTNSFNVEVDGEKVGAALSLVLPFADKYGEQHMTLIVGAENAQAKTLKQFVPKTVSPQLYEWLKESVNTGRVTGAEFIYHGSLSGKPEVSPSIQLYANLFDGNVVFDPAWPELEGITGTLLLDNDYLDVDVSKAEILGNSVGNTKITLINSPEYNGSALSILGGLSSDTSSALELLMASPIGEIIGTAFDDWKFSGKVATNVELIIPLDEDATEAHHKVNAHFSDTGIHIGEVDLFIENVNGVLNYHSETGFSSDNLKGTIWEKDFAFDVDTVQQGEVEDTVISFNGNMAMSDVVAWSELPVLMYMEGETRAQGKVWIYGEEDMEWPVEIEIESDLVGVDINLPKPIYKDSATPVSLKGLVQVGEEDNAYRAQLGDVVDFYYRDALELNKDFAVVKLNDEIIDQDLVNPRLDYFTILGSVDYFNLDNWILSGEKFEEFESSLALEVVEDEMSAFAIEVDVADLDVDFLNIPSAHVSALMIGEDWQFNVESDLLSGDIFLLANQLPRFDLEYIRLDERASQQLFGEEEVDPDVVEEPFAVKDLEPFDFSVGQLMIEGKDLGLWHFKTRIENNVATFKDIYIHSPAMETASESGELLVWTDTPEGITTELHAKIKADNVSDTLSVADLDPVVTSKSAELNIDMQWAGAPQDVALDLLEGNVAFKVNKGSFVRDADPDDTELLRLIALLNFDTLARRLKLDFSDLASEGFAFDTVKGALEFDSGNMHFSSPLEVESSSSYIKMGGDVDLINETVDADLVVTLPVTGNLASLVGLFGGLPAGIGVYLVGKIFKKQVDKLSSISYSVKGKWEDPKIRVKKVFDNKAADKKAAEKLRAKRSDALAETVAEDASAKAMTEDALAESSLVETNAEGSLAEKKAEGSLVETKAEGSSPKTEVENPISETTEDMELKKEIEDSSPVAEPVSEETKAPAKAD